MIIEEIEYIVEGRKKGIGQCERAEKQSSKTVIE
jgi:hypothetical protein